MPEGDTIHYAARRIGAALVGKEIVSIETPQPRHAMDRWPQRLSGRAVRAVDARGKHLYLRFDNDLTLHSHLRMRGKWGVYERGRRWTRSPHRAWLVIRTADHEVVQFDGPVLELDEGQPHARPRSTLGPDIIGDEFDERALPAPAARGRPDARDRRRRARPAQRGGHRQHLEVRGLLPRRGGPVAQDARRVRRGGAAHRARDPPAHAAVGRARALAPQAATSTSARTWPAPAAARASSARGQGDDNRTTYWCPGCQR